MEPSWARTKTGRRAAKQVRVNMAVVGRIMFYFVEERDPKRRSGRSGMRI